METAIRYPAVNKNVGPRLIATILLAMGIILFSAVLFNIPSWHLHEGLPLVPALFAAEATLFALGLCAYGIYALLLEPTVNRRRIARLRLQNVAEPWMNNRQWADGSIAHSSFGALLFLWFFAINWWAALGFMALDRGELLKDASVPILILVAALVLIGLLTVRTALTKTIDWIRFGRSTLTIETLPGRPGTTFKGLVRARFKRKPKRPIFVSVSGFTRQWSKSVHTPHEEERRTSDVLDGAPFFELEESIATAHLNKVDDWIAIPIRFEIPSDAPSSGPTENNAEVIWKIHMRTTGKNDPKFAAEFEIPIFAG